MPTKYGTKDEYPGRHRGGSAGERRVRDIALNRMVPTKPRSCAPPDQPKNRHEGSQGAETIEAWTASRSQGVRARTRISRGTGRASTASTGAKPRSAAACGSSKASSGTSPSTHRVRQLRLPDGLRRASPTHASARAGPLGQKWYVETTRWMGCAWTPSSGTWARTSTIAGSKTCAPRQGTTPARRRRSGAAMCANSATSRESPTS